MIPTDFARGFDAFVIGDDEAEHLEDGFSQLGWVDYV